ncbi:MAG: amidohydrolase [Planctomycetales bacterium]
MPCRARIAFLFACAGLCIPAPHAAAAEPKAWIDRELESLVAIYQEFHRNPELSFHERETAARLAGHLEKAGFEVTRNVGGHGVVGVLKNGDGPTVMVRTDLDALPVEEKTGLPYASKVVAKNDEGVTVPVMHACGHDIHIANQIGVARYMAAHRDVWSGTLICIGQPAEERGAGAAAMLQDGLFEKFPRPDFALALHVGADLPTGFVGYVGGAAMANVDSVDITMQGRGGHGSAPHLTIDPIAQAAALIVDLQQIVSRETSPLEPVVVTVGAIHGGTKHNIIPDSCHLQLTVRTYGDESRKRVKDAIARKARAIAESHRAPEPEVRFGEGTPSLFNDERLVERVVPVFRQALGEQKVVPIDRSMGGEDFSQYGRAGVPIFMYRLGSVDAKRLDAFANRGATPPSLHSGLYYPDAADTLRTGVVTMSAALLDLMPAREGR